MAAVEKPKRVSKSDINSIDYGYPPHLFYLAFRSLQEQIEYINNFTGLAIGVRASNHIRKRLTIPYIPTVIIFEDGSEYVCSKDFDLDVAHIRHRTLNNLFLKQVVFNNLRIEVHVELKPVR